MLLLASPFPIARVSSITAPWSRVHNSIYNATILLKHTCSDKGGTNEKQVSLQNN